MYEYSSVSASSYDPGALVAKLNDSSAEGWEVVSIVPTGGDVSAFLRREAATADGDDAGGSGDAVEAFVVGETVETWTAETGPDAEPAGEIATEVIVVEDVVEPDALPDSGVEEPAGWATAPEPEAPVETPAETAVVAEVPPEPEPVATEPVLAEQAEPEPSPAPTPQPAPVVTTPAGWYPDPSGRYELRYWDGTQWTEHVARQGQQFTDPPIP
jgi:hypothetical protein